MGNAGLHEIFSDHERQETGGPSCYEMADAGIRACQPVVLRMGNIFLRVCRPLEDLLPRATPRVERPAGDRRQLYDDLQPLPAGDWWKPNVVRNQCGFRWKGPF